MKTKSKNGTVTNYEQLFTTHILLYSLFIVETKKNK